MKQTPYRTYLLTHGPALKDAMVRHFITATYDLPLSAVTAIQTAIDRLHHHLQCIAPPPGQPLTPAQAAAAAHNTRRRITPRRPKPHHTDAEIITTVQNALPLLHAARPSETLTRYAAELAALTAATPAAEETPTPTASQPATAAP